MKDRVPRQFFGGNEITLDMFASSKLFLPDAPEPIVRLNNITKFIRLYFILILILVIFLSYEIIKHKFMFKENIGIVSLRRFDVKQRRRYKKKTGFEDWVMGMRDKIFNPIIII